MPVGGYLNQNRPVSNNASTSAGTSTQETRLIPGMLGLYQQNLGLQMRNYQNVLNSFTNGINAVGQQLPGIAGGYGDLWGNVRNTLGLGGGGWGVAAPAARAIDRAYAQNAGRASQQLTTSGLGNSTVAQAVQRGITRDASDAYANLGAQLAQLGAGYQSQLGQQSLAARMQGLGLQTGLAQAAGGTLGNYRFSNNVGSLTGGFGQSTNTSSSTGQSLGAYQDQGAPPFSFGNSGGGYRGSGGGSGSGGQSAFGYFGDPLANAFNNRLGYSGAYGYGGFGVPYDAYGDPNRAIGYGGQSGEPPVGPQGFIEDLDMFVNDD